MKDTLLEDLIDSMVDELSESKLDLREFIINSLDNVEKINHYNKTLKEWRDNLDETNDYEQWIAEAIDQLLEGK